MKPHTHSWHSILSPLSFVTCRIPILNHHFFRNLSAWDVDDLVDVDHAVDMLLEPLAALVSEQV